MVVVQFGVPLPDKCVGMKTSRHRLLPVRYSFMAKEPVVNLPVVTKFVRDVIGCNCPDEVFQRIEIQHGSSTIKSCSADCELRIGRRLLIVVTSEPAELLASHLDRV